ncbi:MAG: DUF2934 domain-containing protein [Shinella sp.]
MNMSRYDQIRQRAYEIWQAEGSPSGSAVRHWTMAEAEIDWAGEASVPFKGFSVLGERDANDVGGDHAASAERADIGGEVSITAGKEPPRRKIKQTEGP